MAEAKAAPQGDPDSGQLRELKLTCMANLLSTTEERVYFKDLESRFLFVSAGWLTAYAPDLLFLSRMRSGQLALEYRATNLAEAAAEAVAEARPEVQLKNIDLSLSAAAVPPFIADPSRIGQLLGNLISNAVKFTPPGGRVEVRVGEIDGQAIVTVSDTGMGIPAADLERVFERFYRTPAATRQVIPGTGLGLAIAKAIVEAHNGSIAVDSTEGLGSMFTVLLPLRPVPATAGDPAQAPRPGH